MGERGHVVGGRDGEGHGREAGVRGPGGQHDRALRAGLVGARGLGGRGPDRDVARGVGRADPEAVLSPICETADGRRGAGPGVHLRAHGAGRRGRRGGRHHHRVRGARREARERVREARPAQRDLPERGRGRHRAVDGPRGVVDDRVGVRGDHSRRGGGAELHPHGLRAHGRRHRVGPRVRGDGGVGAGAGRGVRAAH
ncbi:MAG: hypothetical protein ACK559_27605, partial [bacterium]